MSTSHVAAVRYVRKYRISRTSSSRSHTKSLFTLRFSSHTWITMLPSPAPEPAAPVPEPAAGSPAAPPLRASGGDAVPPPSLAGLGDSDPSRSGRTAPAPLLSERDESERCELLRARPSPPTPPPLPLPPLLPSRPVGSPSSAAATRRLSSSVAPPPVHPRASGFFPSRREAGAAPPPDMVIDVARAFSEFSLMPVPPDARG
mmetsp:Transcript_24852/g.86560  ORF Transcript_24852/g.86560 Transcript_24852/m.86560 type:complete len:202 (+) Transcript_24852:1056-1661(+)